MIRTNPLEIRIPRICCLGPSVSRKGDLANPVVQEAGQ
jgi:hypothetical protein